MIKYFEAFAGIGAFRSAFEKVGGFECVGWCEIDRFAQKAYRTLYDTESEVFFDDARKINPNELPDFDLICGGFPCQSFSIAGKRGGFDDARGTLFFEVARIVAVKKPKYLLLENVPGLLSHDSGRTFATILNTLDELGYNIAWQVLNSTNFGIPQSRKRLFLIGFLGNRCPTEILAFGGNDEENCEKRKPDQLINGSQGSRVYSTNGTAVTQCSGGGGMGGKGGLYFIDSNSPPNLTDKARCITARQNSGVSNHKGEHSAVFCDLNDDPKITDNARCIHTRMDLGVTNGTHKGERSGVLIDDAPRAIINPFKENTRQNGRRVKNPNEPMFTITVTDRHGVVHKGRIRRLMPIECWKLMGFTDEQFHKVQAAGMRDSQLYKQAGNSIVVAVLVEIAKNLKRFDEEMKVNGE